jgi:hypothetical protein
LASELKLWVQALKMPCIAVVASIDEIPNIPVFVVATFGEKISKI